MSVEADPVAEPDTGTSVDTAPPADTVAGVHYRYPGSPPFRDSELDRRLFRGRDKEADTVLHSILSSDLFLLYAVSGLGKTSLLNAGVMHELRARGHWPVSVRLNDPTKPPVQEIREQIEDSAAADPDVDLQRDPNFEGDTGPDASLWDLLASLEVWRGNDLQRLVIILDQFEELFTLGWDEAVRQRFITDFGEVVRGHRLQAGLETTGVRSPSLGVKFVLVIREDALGELEALAADVPQIMRNRFRLGPLDVDQAEAAIREPALVDDGRLDSQRFTYTAAACAEILDFLRTRTERGTVVRTGTVDPSQLQIVCQYVERAILPTKGVPEPGQTIEIDQVDLGGKAGLELILGDFYRRVLQSFPAAQQKDVRHLCERGLINPAGRRLSLEEGEICGTYNVLPEMLRQLVDERLLRADPRVGSVYYELAHDTLVGPILGYAAEQRTIQRRRARRWIVVGAGVAALLVAFLLAYTLGSGSSDDEVVAVPLEVGEPLTSSIDEAGDEVRFALPPDEGRTLLVTVLPVAGESGSSSGGDLNAVVELTIPEGVRRLQNQLGRGQPEHMVVSPAAATTATREVRVTSPDSTTGVFEITLEEVVVTDLQTGSTENGDIAEPGSLAVFRVDPSGADAIAVDITPTPPPVTPTSPSGGQEESSGQGDGSGREGDSDCGKRCLDVVAERVDPTGVGSFFDSNGAGESETVPIVGSEGPNLVVVRGYQAITGPFTIAATQLEQTLAADEPSTGEITPEAEVAEFPLALPGGGTYAIVTVVPDEEFDPVVDIREADGDTQFIDNDGQGGAEDALIGDEAGVYFVSVSGFEGSTGAFTIEVDQQRSEPLVPDQPVSREVGPATDSLLFTVDLDDGGSFALVSVVPDDGVDAFLEVIDPAGEFQYIDNDGDSGAEDALIGDAPGRYLIRVSGYEGSTGAVEVVATPLQVTALEPGGTVTATGPTVFEVAVADGEVLVLRASPASPDTSFSVRIEDAEGGFLQAGSTSPGEPADVILPSGFVSNYLVLVNSSGQQDYTATLTEATVSRLEPGDNVTASTPAAFEVPGPTGDVIAFTADPQAADSSLSVEFDTDGFPFDQVQASAGETATMFMGSDLASEYLVVVVASSGPGDFTATVGPVTSAPLEPGETRTASGQSAFDVELDDDEVLDFTAEPESAEEVVSIRVFDGDGFFLDRSDSVDGEPAIVTLDASLGDTYQVMVSSSGGQYTITLG
jgi:hypothetical protein